MKPFLPFLPFLTRRMISPAQCGGLIEATLG